MSTWYYCDNKGRVRGPVTGEQLEELARQGMITAETVVGTEGGKDLFPDIYGMPLLHVAVQEENFEFVKFLVSHGADVNGKDTDGSTVIHRAANRNEKLAIIRFLVSKGAGININTQDMGGDTPLHVAAFSGYVAVAQYLVSQGADVNIQNREGCTPLHQPLSQYSLNNNLEMVKYLVSQGADVNAKDKKGSTPLHLAVSEKEKAEIAKFLISAGAGVSIQDKYGRTPFDIAKKKRNKTVIEYFPGTK